MSLKPKSKKTVTKKKPSASSKRDAKKKFRKVLPYKDYDQVKKEVEAFRAMQKKRHKGKAELEPVSTQRLIDIPKIVDMDRNRNWQAKCIYLLFTEHYWSDTNYNLNELGRRLEIRLFDNGRERGYTFRDPDTGKEISVCEARSSDTINIYPFNWENALNDESNSDYQNKTKYIKPREFYKAYNYIMDFLEISDEHVRNRLRR